MEQSGRTRRTAGEVGGLTAGPPRVVGRVGECRAPLGCEERGEARGRHRWPGGEKDRQEACVLRPRSLWGGAGNLVGFSRVKHVYACTVSVTTKFHSGATVTQKGSENLAEAQ